MARATWMISLVLLMGLILRIVSIAGYDLWQVEAQNAWLSGLPFSGLVALLKESGVRPPLYFWLLKLWSLASHQTVWLRLLSVVLSLASIWIIYRVGAGLFSRKTGFVAAALAAVSPLLAASAGVMVAPYALDVFLAGLILLTFIRLIASSDRWAPVAHGLALAAGAYANPFLLMLLLAEGLFILVRIRRLRMRSRGWMLSSTAALLLFLPWMPVTAAQVHRSFGHDALITDATGLRVSCLFTELSLGRLYAWSPLTPVISVTPPNDEDERLAMRRPDPARDHGLAGWLQALQMICLGCFFMLALVGFMAAMRLNAWPVPAYLKVRAVKAALKSKGSRQPGKTERGITDSPREGALLLALCFLVPVTAGLVFSIFGGWDFEGSEMIFLAFPYLILVARGIGVLEWRPMYLGALLLILASSALFTMVSKDIGGLTDGSRAAAYYLETHRAYEGKDAVVHAEPLTYFPFLFYTEGRIEPVSFVADGEGPAAWGNARLKTSVCIPDETRLAGFSRVWWISIAPEEGSLYAGALKQLSLDSEGTSAGRVETAFEPLPDWTKQETVQCNNIMMTLYVLHDEGD